MCDGKCDTSLSYSQTTMLLIFFAALNLSLGTQLYTRIGLVIYHLTSNEERHTAEKETSVR